MTDWAPPEAAADAGQIEFLKGVDSPTIANAIERFAVRDRTEGFLGGNIRCLFPDLGVMVGHALTVRVTNAPGAPAGSEGTWRMWQALERMPRPSMIVMGDASGEPSRVAYAGEVMATIAQRLGAVGMVTDGGYRDLNEVHALGFHYFAAYAVVSHANFSIAEVGVPVTLDGQVVQTGDLLHGDANGIVVVPAAVVADLPDAVQAVRDRERRLLDFAKSEGFTLSAAQAY